jgi:endonuclease YncB( thermonuclease family)
LLLALAGGLVPPCRRAGARPPAVVRAISGLGRLGLADGTTARLASVLIPDSPGDGTAIAARAKALLEGLVLGQPVVLETMGIDRQGCVRAEARSAAGAWLQGELVAAGLAWVWPEAGDGQTQALLRLEAAARTQRRGLWASPTLGEQAAGHVKAAPPRFVVILGRIRSVGKGRRWLYLNFGDDWRHDLTARFDTSARPRPQGPTIDLSALAGRLVRVRGWVFALDGPMIELVTSDQVEIVA